MSLLPGNRIPEIIKRMDVNSSQAEAMKTCFGILAIMSREESNKVLIAKDGMEVLLNAMTIHIDRTDVQEAGCDLLWSLAFNSSVVKEIIAKFNGAVVLVRALKRHSRSPDFLKSACGALSNICQYRQNQEAVAYQGGLQPLVGSIHIHQTNSKLLPFVFDAIASIIVNNEENARSVSSLGIIPVIVASLSRHKMSREVVKSGCHTLAILSDVKGQASKIAFAGGVPIILSLLDIHPLYSDLHRVAAVVLLRMLQESSHVGREICCHDGVRILLYSLEKGGAQQDTVAAVTHILYTVTNPSSISATSIEQQLWYKSENCNLSDPEMQQLRLNSDLCKSEVTGPKTALAGVVNVLKQYSGRRDVVRAACRFISNLSVFEQVVYALESLNILDKLFECASIHKDAKDVIEAASNFLKLISKKNKPRIVNINDAIRKGLLHILKSKLNDEEVIIPMIDLLIDDYENNTELYSISDCIQSGDSTVSEPWHQSIVTHYLSVLEKSFNIREDSNKSFNVKSLLKILGYLEKVFSDGKLNHLQQQYHNVKSQLRSLKSYPELAGLDVLILNEDKVPQLFDHVNLEPPTLSNEIILNEDKVEEKKIKKKESDNVIKLDNNTCHKIGISPKTDATVSDNTNSSYSNTIIGTERNRLLPRHPTSEVNNIESKSRLLDTWPNYLERLLLSNNLKGGSAYEYPSSSRMHICYESSRPGGRAIQSKCPIVTPYQVPPGGIGSTFDHSLTFDSEFESGNLYRAVQVGDASYDLFLRPDIHTLGHTQWFYFAVSNTHPAELVRLSDQGVVVPSVRVSFNIVNFTKPDSLFNLGMRPVVYSTQDAKTKNVGWVRAGTDISYYANSYSRSNTAGEGSYNYFTLSFTLEFQHPKDTVLVAYSYPFTMADYKHHIHEILARPNIDNIMKRYRLCTTLAGEDCDLLVITDFNDKDRLGPVKPPESDIDEGNYFAQLKSTKLKDGKNKVAITLKPALFLSARVHPGETPASWMMKGMLDFLCSDTSQSKLLRQIFVIFVVPMLNPDGVIYGNNRCSLAGVDLNRQWKVPTKTLHPTIYHLKWFMSAQRRIRDISMYVDLHGHSRKYNVFMYGCDEKKKPRPQVRAFPKLLSTHAVGSKYVCYDDCSFHVKKGRESTARVVVAKEMNIPCSFTLEATFCGSNYGPLKNCHMNIGHLQEVGAAVCDAFLQYAVSEGYAKDLVQIEPSIESTLQRNDHMMNRFHGRRLSGAYSTEVTSTPNEEIKEKPLVEVENTANDDSDSDDYNEDNSSLQPSKSIVDQDSEGLATMNSIRPNSIEKTLDESWNKISQRKYLSMTLPTNRTSNTTEVMESLSVRSCNDKEENKSIPFQSEKSRHINRVAKEEDLSMQLDINDKFDLETRRRNKVNKLKPPNKSMNNVSRSAGGQKSMELSGIGMQRFSECLDKPHLPNSSQKDKPQQVNTKDVNEIRGSGSTIVKGEFSDLFFVQNHKTEVDLTKSLAVATAFGLPKVGK